MTTEYLIRINYKSGIQEEVWVTEFTISMDTYSWCESSSTKKSIIDLGVDNIESVYQLDTREF